VAADRRHRWRPRRALEREENDGGAVVIASVTIPASEIFRTDYDNQEDQAFPPVEVHQRLRVAPVKYRP
jgi:hypothetical protein